MSKKHNQNDFQDPLIEIKKFNEELKKNRPIKLSENLKVLLSCLGFIIFIILMWLLTSGCPIDLRLFSMGSC